MARAVQNERAGHKLTLRSNYNADVTMILMSSGKSARLWIGKWDDINDYGRFKFVASFSGPATLRRLAKAILREVGDE